MEYYFISRSEWEKKLESLLPSHWIFAPIASGYTAEFELLTPVLIPSIIYNKPKPLTPLKSFFLPVKENVTSGISPGKPRIIIGSPNCDVEALKLLDQIYLDKEFEDIFYRQRRNNTLIIGSDCHSTLQHCHCSTYGVTPFSNEIADLAIVVKMDMMLFRIITGKGRSFIEETGGFASLTDNDLISEINRQHEVITENLNRNNKGLPDYGNTGELIKLSEPEIWDIHSGKCVSCGACTSICPTCTCFLLIDKPGFAKVKQLDACQYPGFERVAGGEDALGELSDRFKNRYLCKFVWKPSRFGAKACTGCGRCIEACIGKISKNEIFLELAKHYNAG